MKNYWVSWYTTEKMGLFDLYSPWWYTGHRVSDGAPTVCAAVKAQSEEEAKLVVLKSYDKTPLEIEWRFCNERPADWSPFNARFPRGKWMEWEEPNDA